MKRFLIHTGLFSAILLASFLMVFSMADGTTDAFYSKFSSPKQTSLIVGSSRASQGIHPGIIDSVYGSNNIYNYGFAIPTSPYGEAYYNSISRKVDRKSKKGVFILGVNPWTLSVYKSNIEGEFKYSEDGSFMEKTHFVNMNPNLEYLIESFIGKNETILSNKNRKGAYRTYYVHDNGWLEVTIESDMFSKSEKTKDKMKLYRETLPNYEGFSEYRLDYLIKTINLFKEHGEVYLVRIPVIEEMLEIENELVPDFDKRMEEVGRDYQIPYINMIPFHKDYDYTDGNHLTSASAKRFSLDLAIQMDKWRKRGDSKKRVED